MNARAHGLESERELAEEPPVGHAVELAKRLLSGEVSLREVARVSAVAMRARYEEAVAAYEAGDCQRASAILSALVTVEPHEASYWLLLAVSEQQRGAHRSALACFGVAAQLDGTDPVAHLFAAQSWRSLGERRLALEAADAAIGCAMGRADQIEPFRQALRLREHIRADEEVTP